MSDLQASQPTQHEGTPEELESALFAQMVLQQANLAMMLLGQTPHPESGQTMRDIEGAKLFIDQLEMLEVKTKGNLNKEESALLKQSLMGLRMAFVECVNSTPAGAKPRTDAGAPSGGSAPVSEPAQPVAAGLSGGEEESRKKFTKKY